MAVPIPAMAKPPNFKVKSPVPSTRVMAATIMLRLSVKSTLLSTQMRAPATAIRPKITMLTPPMTGSGMVWIRAPNLGEKPSRMANRPATTNSAVE